MDRRSEKTERAAALEMTGAENAKEAAELYEAAAEDGDAEALNRLADYYRCGVAVGRDIKKAFEMYRASSEAGCVRAMFNVGICFLFGDGVERDTDVARRYLSLAADGGDGEALYMLGNILFKERRYKEALELYERSARLGCASAMKWEGYMRVNGLGCEKDPEGIEILKRAADMGCYRAYEEIARCYHDGHFVEESDEMCRAEHAKMMRLAHSDCDYTKKDATYVMPAFVPDHERRDGITLGRIYRDTGELFFEGVCDDLERNNIRLWKGLPIEGTVYWGNGNKRYEGKFQRAGFLEGKAYYASGALKFIGRYIDKTFGFSYYGPSYPEEGEYYSEDGNLVYRGKFEVGHQGGVGYPKVYFPEGYGSLEIR